MKERRLQPRSIAVAVLLAAAVVALFIARRQPASNVADAVPASEAAKPTAVPAAPVEATPTPFWDDPAAERERLRTPIPPPAAPSGGPSEFAVEPHTGQVLADATKRGIYGAEITSWIFDRDVYRLDLNYPEPQRSTISDAEGRFNLPNAPVPPGRTLGWLANASGHETLMLLFPEGEGLDDRLRTTFLLGEAGSIGGVVVDQEGTAIPGALVGDIVLAAETAGEETFPWAATSSYAYSDDEGRFLLEGLSKTKQYRIPVRADGYVSVRTEAAKAGEQNLRIVLYRGDASIAGRVSLHDGTPAADARVGLRRVGNAVPGADLRPRVARTDERGEYSFPDLAAGEYQIEAFRTVPDAFGPGCRAVRELVLQPRQVRREDIALPAPSLLSGGFFDATTGVPVEGVRIQQAIAEAEERARAHSIETGADGQFEFVAYVPDVAGGYEVRLPIVLPEGYVAAPPARTSDAPWVEQNDLSFPAVVPGEAQHGEFALERGVVVRGEVVEPDGAAPAAGAPVFLNADGFSSNAMTDAEGKFAASVPRGRELDIEVSSELGIGGASLRPLGDETVRIQLQAWGSLKGVVVNESGEPQPDLEVKVARPGGAAAFSSALRFEETDYTNERGEFEIGKVAFGEVALEVLLSSSSPYVMPDPMRLALRAGESRDDLRIVLREGDFIEGVVLDDATDDPIEGASIVTSLRQVAASSGADGRFRLTSIPRDVSLDYVSASKKGYGEQTRRQVSFYAGDLVFRLHANGALDLRAVDGQGSPLPNWRLALSRDGAVIVDVPVASSGGVHSIDDLARGSYRAEVVELLADGSSGRSGAEDFVFEPRGGERREVTVRVEGDLALDGIVLDGESPAGGAVVTLLDPPASMIGGGGPGNRTLQATAAGDGTFRFAPIPRGSYTVRAQREDRVSETTSVVVGDGGGAATLVLQPAPRVHGTIVGEDGEKPRAATLHFMPLDGAPSSDSLAARDGAYDRTLPAAGRWRIAAAIDGTRQSDSREVAVASGESVQVDFDFSKRVTLRGVLSVDGAAPAGGDAVLLRSDLGQEAILVPDDLGRGAYEVRIAPGTWRAYLLAGPLRAPVGRVVNVTDAPPEQRADISVSTGQLEVVVVAPGDPFPAGELSLETGVGGSFSEVLRLPIDQPALRGIALPAGNYRAVFRVGGEEQGRSLWTSLPPGGAAAAVVE